MTTADETTPKDLREALDSGATYIFDGVDVTHQAKEVPNGYAIESTYGQGGTAFSRTGPTALGVGQLLAFMEGLGALSAWESEVA